MLPDSLDGTRTLNASAGTSIVGTGWLLSAMTIADLAKKMHCGKCGNRDVAYKAWRQEDAPGFAKRY
jgi:hypothetical protein